VARRATIGTCSCGAGRRDRSVPGPDHATRPVDVTAGLLSTYRSNAVPESVVAHGCLHEPSGDSHSLGIDEPPASVLVDCSESFPKRTYWRATADPAGRRHPPVIEF